MTTDSGETVLVGPQDERRRSLDSRWHVCLAKDLNGGLVLQFGGAEAIPSRLGPQIKIEDDPGGYGELH
jgi:hypothetical protein